MGLDRKHCTPEDVVKLKHETRTTLSHAGLAKKVEFLGFSQQGAFGGVRWKTLDKQMYGVPFYLKKRQF